MVVGKSDAGEASCSGFRLGGGSRSRRFLCDRWDLHWDAQVLEYRAHCLGCGKIGAESNYADDERDNKKDYKAS